jgi:hypothetical protein
MGKRARSTKHTAFAPEGLDRFNPKLVQKPIGAMSTSYRGRRANRGAQPARASAERENERESTGMEQGAATAASAKFECGARCKNKLLRILRQTQVLERVIRRSRIFVQPPTDTGSSICIHVYNILLYMFIHRLRRSPCTPTCTNGPRQYVHWQCEELHMSRRVPNDGHRADRMYRPRRMDDARIHLCRYVRYILLIKKTAKTLFNIRVQTIPDNIARMCAFTSRWGRSLQIWSENADHESIPFI